MLHMTTFYQHKSVPSRMFLQLELYIPDDAFRFSAKNSGVKKVEATSACMCILHIDRTKTMKSYYIFLENRE